jgi:hypothetical protein
MAVRALAVTLLLAAVAWAQGPALTTVQDTLFGATGTVTITAAQTFTTADGYVIPKGYQVVATLGTGGTLSVALPPNVGSTPSGTYYMAYYQVTPGGPFTETWVVPSTPTTVDLAAVRTLLPPTPSMMFAFSQINAPPGCANGQIPQYIAPGWDCVNSSGTGTVTSVGLAAPSWLAVAGSPVTTAGTLTLAAATGQALNEVLGTGSSGTLGLEALGLPDLPTGCSGCVLLGQGSTTPPAYIADPEVQGLDAAGSAPTGNPVLVGGYDGTDVRTLKTDTSGDLVAVFAAAQPVTQSGTWTVTVGAAIPAGTNDIGKVDINSMPDVAQASGANLHVDVDSLPAADVQGHAGAALDGAAGATAPANSVQVGGVYNSTAPAPASGQIEPLQLDSSGYLKVNCIVGCSGGGNVNITDWDSVALGAPTSWGTAPSGVVPGVNADVLALPALAAGSNTIGAVDQAGTWTVAQSGTWAQNLTELAGTALGAPTAWGTAPSGDVLGVNANVLALPPLPAGSNAIGSVSVSNFPATQPVSGTVTTNAGTGFPVVDPCSAQQPSKAVINLTANTQLITGTASKQTYICSEHLVSAAPDNIALVEGTGTVCGTGTAGMMGGATAATGDNLGATGGFIQPPTGRAFTWTATAGDNVCLLVSGATQVSGVITYVQQ